MVQLTLKGGKLHLSKEHERHTGPAGWERPLVTGLLGESCRGLPLDPAAAVQGMHLQERASAR